MTREEEIDNAKTAFYKRVLEDDYYYDPRDCFEEGAKWADNNICLSSIWNDTSIIPSDNKGITYLTKNNKLGVLNSVKSNNWDWYVADKYSIIKWAYIDDLLP